jgi:ABC-type lipoprotein release transport system permease subunit
VLTLIASNMLRRKARTLATAVGIAIGVGTIVALLSVGSGLKQTAAQLVHLGAADAGIFQNGVSDPTASKLPVALTKRVSKLPYVEEATPVVLVVEGVKPNPAAVVFGADPNGFFAKRLVTSAGRLSLAGESVMVGNRLAHDLHLAPGGKLRVKKREFTVAGVYHTGVFFEDTGAVINLQQAQRINDAPGEATTIPVQFKEQSNHAASVKALKRELPGIQVIGTPEQASRVGANGQLVQNAVTIIAALALIVGGLGVTNTMAMAVLERKRELALLSAVGWRRRRVALLVLAEGIATSVVGAGMGLLLGVVGARALGNALDISAIVTPRVTAESIWQSLLIGIAIGAIGSLYPAWRGTTVSGAELLQGG